MRTPRRVHLVCAVLHVVRCTHWLEQRNVTVCNVTITILIKWLHLLTEGIDVGVLYCCLNWGWRQQQGIGGLTSDSLFGGDMGVTNPSNKQGGLHQSWQWALVILQLLWSRSSKPHTFIWRFIHAGALKRPHISSYFHTKPIFMLRTDQSFWAGNTINMFILQENTRRHSDGVLWKRSKLLCVSRSITQNYFNPFRSRTFRRFPAFGAATTGSLTSLQASSCTVCPESSRRWQWKNHHNASPTEVPRHSKLLISIANCIAQRLDIHRIS